MLTNAKLPKKPQLNEINKLIQINNNKTQFLNLIQEYYFCFKYFLNILYLRFVHFGCIFLAVKMKLAYRSNNFTNNKDSTVKARYTIMLLQTNGMNQSRESVYICIECY